MPSNEIENISFEETRAELRKALDELRLTMQVAISMNRSNAALDVLNRLRDFSTRYAETLPEVMIEIGHFILEELEKWD